MDDHRGRSAPYSSNPTGQLLKDIATPPETPSPINMTAADAAAYLCSNTSTLADWRMKGVGPRWARAGRRVIYRRLWLDEWLDSRSVQSTAEAKRLDML